MLEYKSISGHVFYLNHLISAIAIGVPFLWVCSVLNKGRMDLFLHAAVCAGVTLSFIFLLPIVGIPWWIAPVLAMLIGLGKEGYDYLNPSKGTFEFMDIFADFVGIAAVTVFYLFSFIMSDLK